MMIQLALNVIGDGVLAQFLTTSARAFVVAVVTSAVVGFIVWWAVALAVCFLALAAWRLRRRLSPAACFVGRVRAGRPPR
jgi:hypothetical protein